MRHCGTRLQTRSMPTTLRRGRAGRAGPRAPLASARSSRRGARAEGADLARGQSPWLPRGGGRAAEGDERVRARVLQRPRVQHGHRAHPREAAALVRVAVDLQRHAALHRVGRHQRRLEGGRARGDEGVAQARRVQGVGVGARHPCRRGGLGPKVRQEHDPGRRWQLPQALRKLAEAGTVEGGLPPRVRVPNLPAIFLGLHAAAPACDHEVRGQVRHPPVHIPVALLRACGLKHGRWVMVTRHEYQPRRWPNLLQSLDHGARLHLEVLEVLGRRLRPVRITPGNCVRHGGEVPRTQNDINMFSCHLLREQLQSSNVVMEVRRDHQSQGGHRHPPGVPEAAPGQLLPGLARQISRSKV
mmetsp:Transcript_113681/g.321893  ORF Transcript_113681/g.321893 Transcript_113681/m.321893 type:complete len:357 (+) Transcript_113681:177-1247(+)